MGDGRQLGTTPVDDVRPADGRLVNYRFRLAGHTDVQMPFQVTTSGRFELTAKLYPTERRSEARPSASGRAGKRGHDKKRETPAAAPTTRHRSPRRAGGRASHLRATAGVAAARRAQPR